MELNAGEVGAVSLSLLVAYEALKYGKEQFKKRSANGRVDAREQMQTQITDLHEVVVTGKDGKESLVTQVALNTVAINKHQGDHDKDRF